MFNVVDVAVNHYVDWDWRAVLAVTVVGLVFAGFSCWLSFYFKQIYWPTWLSISARVLPQYVAVLCVWLGVSRLESGRSAFWVYLLLAALLLCAFWRYSLDEDSWLARGIVFGGALALTALAALSEVLRRAAATIPMSVSSFIFLILAALGFMIVAANRQ